MEMSLLRKYDRQDTPRVLFLAMLSRACINKILICEVGILYKIFENCEFSDRRARRVESSTEKNHARILARVTRP